MTSPTPPPLPRPVTPINYPLAGASYQRPGVLTAVAVLSITFGVIGILASGFTSLMSAGFAMSSAAMRSVATTPASPPTPAPAPATDSPTPTEDDESLPVDGMPRADRTRLLDSLSTLRPLSSARRAHLDALLSEAGKKILPLTGPSLAASTVRANVTDSGQYPSGTNKPSAGADFFVFARGTVEISDHHAVFHPTGPGDSIRASAPAPDESEATEDSTAQSPATTSPASTTTLTTAHISQIIKAIETTTASKLTPAQLSTLRTHLRSPNQSLFTRPTGPNATPLAAQLIGTTINNGTLTFSTPTGYMAISPTGAVTASASFNFTTTPAGAMMSNFKGPFLLSLALNILHLALAIFLLICGIFILRNSPLARRLHLIYAWLKIPAALAGVAAAIWFFNALTGGQSGFGGPTGPPSWALSMIFTIPAILSLLYPIALLITFNTRTVKDYYAPATPQS